MTPDSEPHVPPSEQAVSTYRSVAVGDEVWLLMGAAAVAAVDGPIAHPVVRLRVERLTENLIYCGEPDGGEADWTFCRETGWEIDEELGIGPQSGLFGSRIVLPR